MATDEDRKPAGPAPDTVSDTEPAEPAPDTANDTKPDAPPPPEPIPNTIGAKRLLVLVSAFLIVASLGALVGPRIGAELKALWSSIAGSKAASETGGEKYYTCGMHPWVIEPHPGNCPICGMTLVPLDPAKFSGEVTIDPVVSQNIGVRVEKVGQGSESGSIRTVGTVTYDERLLGDVNLKVSGWIEKLNVDYLGAPVKRGQALFQLYSPELYAAEGEYLLAYKASQRAGEGTATGLAAQLLEPARTKLALFDIGPGQIRALEKRGKPFKTMTITSPQTGVVVEKQAFEGMKVTPGMTAYRIADLSKVWVMATVYEYQSQQIQVGQKAAMTLTYVPGKTFEGKVVYVYPYLDERTRQINVRLEFSNPDLELKPGMYTTVTFEGVATTTHVLVSRSAVIDTGERQVAFIAKGQGKFEPRRVRMGAETPDGKVEILDGLEPGELVVVSGQFLIDSEARMREALAKMMKGTPVAEATAPKAPAVQTHTLVLPDAANAALGATLDGYLAIGEALAGDTTTDIGVSARKVADGVDGLTAVAIPGEPHFWDEHPEAAAIKDEAKKLAAVHSLDEARHDFATLGGALSKLLDATGVPKSYAEKLENAHCPMYPAGSKGSVWIQKAGAIHNPYFGKAMLTCSDWQRPIEVAR